MPLDERGNPTTSWGASPTYTDAEAEILRALEQLRQKCRAMRPPRAPTQLETAEVVLAVADAQRAREEARRPAPAAELADAGPGGSSVAGELGWARSVLELAHMLGYRRLTPEQARAWDRAETRARQRAARREQARGSDAGRT